MRKDLIVVDRTDTLLPVQIAAAGDRAARRFVEFFTANIRNANTRQSYARAVSDFFRWCERGGLDRIEAVEPVHVAGYIEQIGTVRSAPTVKQHLAAVRMLFDWLVVGQRADQSGLNRSRAQPYRQARQDPCVVAGGGPRAFRKHPN
jgi:site-specific recombinase XerD